MPNIKLEENLQDIKVLREKQRYLEERGRYAHEALRSLQDKEKSGASIYEDQGCQNLVYDIIESVCPEPYEDLVGWMDAIENKIPEGSNYINILEKCYDDELSANFIQLMQIADSGEETEISISSLVQIIEFYDAYFIKRSQELLRFLEESLMN